MEKFLYNLALIVCLAIVAICFIAEAVIQFMPIPEGHSRVGADWYLFVHYWYIHLAFVASLFGVGILWNK